ncbi:unnamed protein product [Meloidogyne enterolobii]|uniref:Uncharacterized protein n=1 Tax=Meloidogyne enterolobii TaxID=390850 RepID=A0ACB1AB91_MELEN
MLECGGKDKDKDVSDSSGKEEETGTTGQRGNGRRVRGQSHQTRTGSSHRSTIQNQTVNPNDRRMVMLSYKHQMHQIKKLRNDWGKLCKAQHKIHKNQKYIKKKMLKLNNLTNQCKHDSENMLKSSEQTWKNLKEIFERKEIF